MIHDIMAVLALTFVCWERNNRVLEFFLSMLDKAETVEELEEIDSVNYLSAFLQFWKPLHPDFWYKNTNFLRRISK